MDFPLSIMKLLLHRPCGKPDVIVALITEGGCRTVAYYWISSADTLKSRWNLSAERIMSKFLRILRRVFLFFIGFVVFLVILSKVLEAYEERHLYDRVLIDMASTTNLSSHNRTGNIDIAIAKRLNKTRKSSNPNLSETLKAELKFPIIKLSTCPQPSPFLGKTGFFFFKNKINLTL